MRENGMRLWILEHPVVFCSVRGGGSGMPQILEKTSDRFLELNPRKNPYQSFPMQDNCTVNELLIYDYKKKK